MGYIKVNGNEYNIEPSKNHKPQKNGQYQHIVTNHFTEKNKHVHYKKSLKKKLKKKTKRRHHNSNCGTREPKRSIETEIKWQPQKKVN